MRKLALILLSVLTLAQISRADINVTEGSGKVVKTTTSGGKEIQWVQIDAASNTISGTVTANISGSISNTAFTANQGSAGTQAWPVTSTYTVVTSTYALNVAGSFSAAASTAAVPTGFVSGTSTVTVSAANPLPISGSFTANASTASVPTGFLSGASTITVTTSNPLPVQSTGTTTVAGTVAATQSGTWTVQPGNTQNTTAWQTISSYTVVTSTYALNVSGSFSAAASTASVPTGFVSGTSTITVSGTNPLPVQSTGTTNIAAVNGATKARTSIFSAQTLTASAADVYSSSVSLTTGYGAQVSIRFTNGATGPTVAAQCQIVTGNDSSFTLPVNFGGPLIGSIVNAAVTSFSIQLPIGVAEVSMHCGSNTGQNVTVDADISNVTKFF